jgi:hypothetical protein
MQGKRRAHAVSTSRPAALVTICLVLLQSVLLTGCFPSTHHSVIVSYQPPFIPVIFSLDSNGDISVTAGASITTYIGTFSIGAQVSTPIEKNSTRLAIIQSVNGATVQNVYDVGERGPVSVCLNGRFLESVGTNSISITALDGTSVISLLKSGNACGQASTSAATRPKSTASKPHEAPSATPTSEKTSSRPAPSPAGSQCVFLYPDQLNCTSSDPEITLEGDFTDDTTGCTFVDQVDWGDGSPVQAFDIAGGPAGPVFVSHHTYQQEGTFAITLNATVIAGPCTAFPGNYSFVFN